MARDPLDNIELYNKYKYGSLNIADTQRNRTLKSPEKLTNPLNSLLTVAENQYDPNLTDSTGPYRAIVLRVEESNSFIAPDSQIQTSLFGLIKKGTAIRARILEYHHAAIPMPPKLDSGDGIHNYFIDMHDIFYSKETLDVKVGDIVEVDYRDRKNKKDPLLLRLIASAKTEGSPNTTTATVAHDGTKEPVNIVTNGSGYSGDSKNCGGIAYEIAPCKEGVINGSKAKLHPTVFDNFQKLVDDAKSAGINIAPASTFRDPNKQYSLRKKYCTGYTTDEELKYGNITCKPAVAPLPKAGSKGGSRHTYGEAIDIKLANGGALAFSKSTAEALESNKVSQEVKTAILWLLANSKNYALYNYSGEAWHYSTDGR